MPAEGTKFTEGVKLRMYKKDGGNKGLRFRLQKQVQREIQGLQQRLGGHTSGGSAAKTGALT